MSQPNDPLDAQLDDLVETLGDICHEDYLGCHMENDQWHYSYKDEVINLLAKPEAKAALKRLIIEREVEELEKLGQHTYENKGATIEGRNAFGTESARTMFYIQERVRHLKSQLAQLEGGNHDD